MVKNKTIKLFLMLWVILFSVCGVVGCSNEKMATSNNSDTKDLDEDTMSNSSKMYYMDVIDLSSSMTFDYEKPNYGYISLNLTSSYIYNFSGEQVYELVSEFNNIPIIPVDSVSKKDELNKLKVNCIDIEVSYNYANQNISKNNAIVHFYISENGILLFEDHRKINLFYSDTNTINFDEFKNKIIQMERH